MSLQSLFQGGNVKVIPSVDAAPVGTVLGVVASAYEGYNDLAWVDAGGASSVTEVVGTPGQITVSTSTQGVATVSIPQALNLTTPGQSLSVGTFQVIEETGDTTLTLRDTATTASGIGVIADTISGLSITTGIDPSTDKYTFPTLKPQPLQVMVANPSNSSLLNWLNIPQIAGSVYNISTMTLGIGNTGAALPVIIVAMGPIKYMILQFDTIYNNPIQNTSGGPVMQFETNTVAWPDESVKPLLLQDITLGYVQYVSAQGSPLEGTTAYGMCAVGIVNQADSFTLRFTLCPSMWGTNGVLNTYGTYAIAEDKFLTLGAIPSDFFTSYGIPTMSSNAIFCYY